MPRTFEVIGEARLIPALRIPAKNPVDARLRFRELIEAKYGLDENIERIDILDIREIIGENDAEV